MLYRDLRLISLLTIVTLLLITGCGKPRAWHPPNLCDAGPGNKFYVGVHGAVATDDDIPTSLSLVMPSYVDSGFVGISGGWVFVKGGALSGEYETSLLRHWGDEDHWEITMALFARWSYFPWNKYVFTTMAYGFGMTYTDALPKRAVANNPEVTNLLHYLPFEVTLAQPDFQDLQLVIRLHHRSGGFGISCPGVATYNSISLGLRYYF